VNGYSARTFAMRAIFPAGDVGAVDVITPS
jgi:hypothetical protein